LEPYYPGESKKKIDSIQFSLLRAKKKKKMRIPINKWETYDVDGAQATLMKNGPLDLRLVSIKI
jgi:hypothetical protein